MPFVVPTNPKSLTTSPAGAAAPSADQADTMPSRPKPISVFASVNGYAQAEIIVGPNHSQPSRG